MQLNYTMGLEHKVFTYKEYHSVGPLIGIGTLPTLEKEKAAFRIE
jgi:hypothetical protein